MWKKFKTFFINTKNFIVKHAISIASGIAFIIGVLIGRGFKRTHRDFDELREAYSQLAAEHKQLVEQANRLRELLSESNEYTKELADELRQSTIILDGATGDVEQLQRDVDSLEATNQRFRDLLYRIREKSE